MTELPGGYINTVLQVGDTVRRPRPERAEFVHALLRHLEGRNWPSAPRFLGLDEEGRQILSYLPGYVAWLGPDRVEPDGVWSEQSMVEVAGLVRELHDLTAGTPLAGNEETVCHNDLSGKNTVYRDIGDGTYRPVALIDWDLAAPGPRINDVADMCSSYPTDMFVPDKPDPSVMGRLMRRMCEAYGLADRSPLIATILSRQDQCWRGIDAQAEAGDVACQRLRDIGAVEAVRGCYQWTAAHRTELETGLAEG